jgi:pimeloyl-ACP methyl ester carboxylesterase
MLEVIDKGSWTKAHPAALLFVHGVGHGAWCWDEHFLDFFADKGCRALAVSLRGHGGSSTSKPLRKCSIADYIDDVDSVAESLPTRPVVIGHSMGGFVVQKYLESHHAPAGVLVASFPPTGSAGMSLRKWKRHPWVSVRTIITGKVLPGLNTPKLAREAFFCAHTPEAEVVRCAAQLQEESPTALLETMFPNRLKPQRVTTPMLVLGAECDGGVTPNEVRATARPYRTEAEFFPDMGHDMMLEPEWAAVAERIHTWLGTHRL